MKTPQNTYTATRGFQQCMAQYNPANIILYKINWYGVPNLRDQTEKCFMTNSSAVETCAMWCHRHKMFIRYIWGLG